MTSRSTAVAFPEHEIRMGGRARSIARTAAVVGVAGLAIAISLAFTRGGEMKAHFFPSYLVSFLFFLSLTLGAMFFVLIQHLTFAGWSVVVRRIAEVVAANMWVMALLAIPILLGVRQIFAWADPTFVAEHPLVQRKAAYLNIPFFTIRAIVCFATWILLNNWFLRRSVEQDRSGDVELTNRMQRVAAPAMFIFAITLTIAAFDYGMSLEPEWFSTMFGVYFFSGSVVSFFAFLPVVTFFLQRMGWLSRTVTLEHYHDMGKLVFAFIIFWTYIAFSQYMLIWYGNLPEETLWFLRRQTGEWTQLSIFLLAGHWAVPFFGLIARLPKRRKAVLAIASIWVLFMHFVDLYYVVMPHTSAERIPLSIVDAACFLGVGGIFVAAAAHRMAKLSLIPVKDPRLA
ncbi:MAG TPA: quinol:cytochrome C oxidoreductase, partial [bacterium]|nr:quinol:cytochrome C oxidoreductase [bacterium]